MNAMCVIMHIKAIEKLVDHGNKMCCLSSFFSSSEAQSFTHRFTQNLWSETMQLSCNIIQNTMESIGNLLINLLVLQDRLSFLRRK